MSINLLTGTGIHINPEEEAKWIQPAVECQSIIIPKKEETVKIWEDILPRVKHSLTKQGKEARIDNSDRNMQDVIVKDGYGIYVDKPAGEAHKNLYYDEYNKSVSRLHISRWEDGSYMKSRYFVTLICALYPGIAKRYILDKGLDVNHVIIDIRGSQRIEYNSEFYEVVNKGRNRSHGSFIKRYNLYGAPVSCFDFDRLYDIYEANGILEVNLNEEFVEGVPLETVMSDLDTYRGAYRRLITWLYYLENHTTNNDRVWRAFYDYFEREFATSFNSLSEFREYIDKMTK